ncbi:MAG: restriction endonuclease [Chloroflexia bacterium]|nr:restriction endonuclease [Chloroflexia bacterium]
MDEKTIPAEGLPEPAGMVGELNVDDLPDGYRYGVTRYADLILREAFPERFRELREVLTEFRIDVDELTSGGGSRATQTIRFDSLLYARGWGRRNITIAKLIDDRMIHSTRGHEIDMFGVRSVGEDYPGIAVEMEWNNKDPFFDRDLINFAALHREGALAVGVIVTRGPTLQKYLGQVIKTGSRAGSKKYGTSTTHWDKIIPRINLGGGGECPLLVVGIEPTRVDGFDVIEGAYDAGEMLWLPTHFARDVIRSNCG